MTGSMQMMANWQKQNTVYIIRRNMRALTMDKATFWAIDGYAHRFTEAVTQWKIYG